MAVSVFSHCFGNVEIWAPRYGGSAVLCRWMHKLTVVLLTWLFHTYSQQFVPKFSNLDYWSFTLLFVEFGIAQCFLPVSLPKEWLDQQKGQMHLSDPVSGLCWVFPVSLRVWLSDNCQFAADRLLGLPNFLSSTCPATKSSSCWVFSYMLKHRSSMELNVFSMLESLIHQCLAKQRPHPLKMVRYKDRTENVCEKSKQCAQKSCCSF